MKKREKKRSPLARSYTYREFLHFLPFCTDEHKKELMDILDRAEKPTEMCGVNVPEDLNLVSYGLLDDLANISASGVADPMAEIISRLLEVDTEKVYEANVFDVFGVSKWVGNEVKRINKLFERISPSYSPEEIAAGVKSLNFGTFGVLDWYANRQRISDQNQVRDVAWIRIYTCMKNDNAKAEFNKRLNKQYQNKIRHGQT